MSFVRKAIWSVLALIAATASVALAQDAGKDPKPFLALDASGHTASISEALFTPDGHEVVSVSNDKTIRLWDMTSGECLRVLRPAIGFGPEGKLYCAALSRDGKMLAVGGYGFTGGYCPIHIISMQTGEVIKMFTPHTSAIQTLAFSPDGTRLLSGAHDNTARITKISSGQVEFVLEGHTSEVTEVAYSPRGDRCVTGSGDHRAIIWNTQTGRQVAVLQGHTNSVRTAKWSPNGEFLITSSYDGTVRTWTNDGKLKRTYEEFGEQVIGVTAITVLPDSRKAIFGLWADGTTKCGVLDLGTGEKQVYEGHDNTVMSSDIAPNGTTAATCDGSGRVCLWNVNTRETLRVLAGSGKRIFSTGWSKDGSTLAWGDDWFGGDLFEATTGLNKTFSLTNLEFGEAPEDKEAFIRAKLNSGITQLRKAGKTSYDVYRGDTKLSSLEMTTDYDRMHNNVHCATLLPGDRAVVGACFGVYLYDVRTGVRIREFIGHTGDCWSVTPSPDGRYFVTSSDDMTLKVWDAEQIYPLMSLFAPDNEWILWTQEGYYAASAGGERLMGWHVNTAFDRMSQFFPAAQFRKTLYNPGLLKLLLRAGSVERALEVAGKTGTDVGMVLPPSVVIVTPDRTKVAVEQPEITVTAVAQQVGEHPITSMQVLLDGRPLGGKSGKVLLERADRQVRREFIVPLSPGEHTIAVRAETAVSDGLSTTITVTCKSARNDDSELPTLYVLAMGVANYDDEALKLNFAARDAQALESTLKAHSSGLYKKVVTKVLVDKQATRTGILGGLLWLKKQMTQHDIGVVFYSGHGDKDETGNFYLLPSDVSREDLVVTGVSDAQVKGILQGIPGRLMILLDACHAGSLGGDRRKNSKSLTDDLVRDLSNDDYGVVVMASSMGREFSLESNEHKSGFFTVALTEGLAGHEAADSNKDGLVYFNELDTFVSNRVRELTNGKQTPVTAKPTTIRPFPLTRRK